MINYRMNEVIYALKRQRNKLLARRKKLDGVISNVNLAIGEEIERAELEEQNRQKQTRNSSKGENS